MNNKVGFKHYKDHDGKNIKYYDWVILNYIDSNAGNSSLRFNSFIGNYTITYNDKFENAVVKSKGDIHNIHRITSIKFGNEIVEEKDNIKITYNDGQTSTYINDNNQLKKLQPWSPETLALMGLGEYVSETDENGHSKYVFRMKKDVKSSPQDILLAMEIEKWKQEQDNKVNNHKGLENLANILKDWNKAFNNVMTPNPITLSKKENKTHKYPLIYKLKEREDYKTMKEKFLDDIKQDVDYVILVYNHEEDRFYREFYQTEEKNITILDVYKK